MSARVLVVDDLLPNLKLLEAKLNSEYYDVLTALSGAQALEIVKTNPPDIILLDVMMPEMDGLETCRRLKADPKTAHLPVVMVTALNEQEDRIQGLKAGADDFLTKPINDLALFARIRSLVRLKIMTDELRLRDQTGGQLGMSDEPTAVDISHANILLVDDDIVQARNITDKLVALEHKVTVFDDASAVLKEVMSNNYDLIIISTQLADADGLRLCSHIRSQERLRHIPLLMLVEEDNTPLLIKGLDIGVNDYLVTPIDGNEVLARVNTQIRRKRYQDALKSSYQKSVSLAVTDELTSLYNRRYFDIHYKALFEKAVASAKPLTLMMVDIDHFKRINDTYGHVEGDKALQQVARRLIQNVRITDLVARYGGEEFVIILPDTSLQLSKEIAERIRVAIAGEKLKILPTHDQACQETTLTISLGIAIQHESDSMEDLLKRADKGLYLAKHGGRNSIQTVERN